MDFKTAFQQAIQFEGFRTDSAQAQAVEQLDRLHENLVRNKNQRNSWQVLWSKLAAGRSQSNFSRGCYLWGSVGRGKTWLMDLFYQSLPFKEKSRLHFHEFMQQVHRKLKVLDGKKDPLIAVANDIAANNRIICLDEFFVADITDAMMLYGLLDALYKNNVVLLMTSNTHPDELYRNGLQRSRFLPAIDLIKERNLLIQVDGEQDHRLGSSGNSTNYLTPLSSDSDLMLEEKFNDLALGPVENEGPVIINNRVLNHRKMASNIIWFDFNELCEGPRASSDYLYLSKNYDYVILSNVFRMDESHDDIAKRFIHLVDALYDRRVGLIVSATASPAELYCGTRFNDEFKRAASRLEEMSYQQLWQNQRQALSERNTLLSG